MMARSSVREFSFPIAFLVAIVLHTGLGLLLKYNPLIAATPIPITPKAPLSMRFVEVPPESKTVPEPPVTGNASDANRKAGPLEKTPEQKVIPVYGQPGAAQKSPSAASSGARPSAANSASNVDAGRQSELPAIQTPDSVRPDEKGDYSTGNSDGKEKAPLLSQSLHHLDRYIDQGNGGGQEGNAPTGDPGSGVFFDTQGFDLGPWGNRVIAIVRSNWIIPVAADMGMKGVVGISFQVDRMGNISEPQIIASSSVPSFDQAAMNALKTSNPFPPLPPDFPRPKLPAIFRFYYNTPVPEK